MRRRRRDPLQKEPTGRNLADKRFIVLDKKHRWISGKQQVPHLHSRKHVHEVERFVPDVKMRAFGERLRKKRFFLLPARERTHVLFELDAREVQLTEDR